jgi:hypothetical protein
MKRLLCALLAALTALALCACGFLLIWGIEYVGNRIAAKKGEA